MANDRMSIRSDLSRTPSRAGGSLEARQRQIECVMKGARDDLAQSVRESKWAGEDSSLSTRTCGNAGPKAAAILEKAGIPAKAVKTPNAHTFVEVKTPEGTLIVDPTIRQFFGKENAPQGVPEIFVGTEAQLKALWTKFEGQADRGRTYDSVYVEGRRPLSEKELDPTLVKERAKLLANSHWDGSSCFER